MRRHHAPTHQGFGRGCPGLGSLRRVLAERPCLAKRKTAFAFNAHAGAYAGAYAGAGNATFTAASVASSSAPSSGPAFAALSPGDAAFVSCTLRVVAEMARSGTWPGVAAAARP